MLFKERKRLWCGLPWTFTVYNCTEDKLIVDTGFLNKRQDEVRLYRITDLTITRSLVQRVFGLGTIIVSSSDTSLGTFELKNIKNSLTIKETLSDLVENQRNKKRVGVREFVDTDDFEGDI